MSEFSLGWVATLRLLLVVVFATLYWIGGRSQRWKHGKVYRRFVGGVLISIGTCGIAALTSTFNWWMICSVFAFPVALSVGYGGMTTTEKLKRRLIYGAALGAAGLTLAIPGANVSLWLFQFPIALWASGYLGIRNPAKSAVDEETLVATASTFVVPFYV